MSKKNDGIDYGEAASILRLDRAEACLSMTFGSNTIYQKVFEATFDAEVGGSYSVVSNVIAPILPSHGLVGSDVQWELFDEITTAVEAHKDPQLRARIRKAFEFYHGGKTTHGSAHSVKFFFYWTAIQILIGGQGTLATNR